MTHAWVTAAAGTTADPSALPEASISVGFVKQTAEKAPQNPVQVDHQQHTDTQISHQEADREAAPADDPADGRAVHHPTVHVALLQQQVFVILSAWRRSLWRHRASCVSCAMLLSAATHSACLECLAADLHGMVL